MRLPKWLTRMPVVLTTTFAAAFALGGLMLEDGAAGAAGPPKTSQDSATAGADAAVRQAVDEVAAAIAEAGVPPCGQVTVSVKATMDGRSWAWPADCHILLDAALVDAGGGPFRYVVRHEIAHLHFGVDHFDRDFRALEALLAGNVGYDLAYAPGEEYPELIERSADRP